MLRPDLCYCSEAYIVSKEAIGLLAAAVNKKDKAEKVFAFENNVLFSSFISKIIKTFIYNAKDLDIVVPMYNLLQIFYDIRKFVE